MTKIIIVFKHYFMAEKFFKYYCNNKGNFQMIAIENKTVTIVTYKNYNISMYNRGIFITIGDLDIVFNKDEIKSTRSYYKV